MTISIDERPGLGARVAWVPAAIYLAANGQPMKAAVLTVWGAVVIGMVDNFLRPRLVGQRAQMHELLIFFAVLGGLQVFGVLGILLGPVVVASVAHLDGHGISAHQIAIVLALGCSTAFLTPVAHPVNLLMMGACNYRQRDLLRLGIPLTLLCALWVALRLWLTR